MSLLDSLKSIFAKDARKQAYVFVPHANVEKPNFSDEPLESGKHYFRLWLAEMFLEKEVNWFRQWYPVTHTLVTFQFGDQTLEIPHVAGASQLKGLTEGNLQKAISLNYPLTTLMPFNGGVVDIVAALVAMKGQDYISSVVKVLGDLSQLLVVPQLSAALSIALPIANGVQDLLGGSAGEMRLGLHQAFVGKGGGGTNLLRGGYIAVIDAPAGDYPEARLFVKQDRLCFGDTMASSDLLTGVTHMLFRIEPWNERDDWASLKNIQEPFNEMHRLLLDGEEEKAEQAKKRAIIIAKTSPDLTRADRNRIALAIKEEFDQAKAGGLGAVPAGDRNLNSLMQRRAISAADALNEDPSWEKLLG
jgi:hypothetical protein